MKEIVLENKQESLNIIENFVEEICEGLNISNTFLGNMLIAITEVVSLIEEQNSMVKVYFSSDDKKFSFVFSDFSKDLELDFLKENTRNNKNENSIFMINALCDDVQVDYTNRKIILEFINAGVDEIISIHRKEYLSKYLNQKIKV